MFSYYPRPFGRYWLLKRLAEGGMGVLHLAATGPPGLEKLCVIKTVLPSRDEPDYIARFTGEAQVLLRLSHGNLVPILDVGHVEGYPYLAMEYVAGKDLRAVWNRCADRRVAFPIEVALHIVRELLRGLHYAHTVAGIRLVHRDVSPQNVLLAYSGEVKLADFGLAKSTLSQVETEYGVVYGKPQYMSPEQAHAQVVDARSDLYSAGIILWEMLTGRPLFPSANLGDRRPDVPPPSEVCSRVPRDLDPIVMMALREAPADRYADGEMMRGALASWLAQEAPTTDAARVAAFLEDLYDGEIERERQEAEKLLQHLRARQQRDTRPPPPPRVQLAPGVLVDGRYRLQRIIGEGGMGQVWAAEHKQIGLQVAVKFLTAVHARGPAAVAAFQREARASSAIRHPNVASVTDAGQYGDTLYLVMELLRGRTLEEVLEERVRLPVDLTLHVGREIGETLVAAHRAGVIHRDLKPANIFLIERTAEAGAESQPGDAGAAEAEARPGVKVLDFGIAVRLQPDEAEELVSAGRALDGSSLVAGTLDYMAPEQVMGDACDGRADVYALGVILYQMLGGDLPLAGAAGQDPRERKLTRDPAPLGGLRPDLPPALVELVMRALRRDPQERQATMRELVDGIVQIQRELERPAGPISGAGVASVAGVTSGAGITAVAEATSGAAGTGDAEGATGGTGTAGTSGTGTAGGTPEPRPTGGTAPDTEPIGLLPPPQTRLWQAAILGASATVLLSGMLGWMLLPRLTGPRATVVDLRAAPDLNAAGLVSLPDLGGPDLRPPDLAAAPDLRPPPDLAPPSPPDLRPPGTGTSPPCPLQPALRQLESCRIELGKGQFQVAQVACQEALCNPRSRCSALAGLAEVALATGDVRRAIQEGERAVRCPTGGIDAHLALGNAYLKAGRLIQAREQYRKVLLIDPENATAREYIEKTGTAPNK